MIKPRRNKFIAVSVAPNLKFFASFFSPPSCHHQNRSMRLSAAFLVSLLLFFLFWYFQKILCPHMRVHVSTYIRICACSRCGIQLRVLVCDYMIVCVHTHLRANFYEIHRGVDLFTIYYVI